MEELHSCIDFTQRLIQTHSLPAQEGAIAKVVVSEMEHLGYDRVFIDDAGNVIGLLRGLGTAPAMMLNTHLDHVDVGDRSRWPHPPFGGEIHSDRICGRGAMDIKGPLAAQVYGVATLVRQGIRPPGDVYVSAVVQEEVGGLGARHLVSHLRPPLVVVGEATGNQLRRGHRGRCELVLHVKGKSVHASVPQSGVNPLFVVGSFLKGLSEIDTRTDPELGHGTVAPTLLRTDQTSPNVVPSEAWLTCDWRRIPGDKAEEIQARLQGLADSCGIDGASSEVLIPVTERTSYTGLKMTMPADNPPFILRHDHPAVTAAESVLTAAAGEQVSCDVWQFATDGGHFAEAGLTVVGYGPGEESLAHTIQESIAIADLEIALAGNRALALEWPAAVALQT
jgi:putative selenium metabolism hydrolase